MKVLIGTKNPGKIQGAKEAFKNYFDTFSRKTENFNTLPDQFR